MRQVNVDGHPYNAFPIEPQVGMRLIIGGEPCIIRDVAVELPSGVVHVTTQAPVEEQDATKRPADTVQRRRR
jgi:hypothetical protein